MSKKPKFRRGQVVMTKNAELSWPFKIATIERDVMFVGDIVYQNGESGWDESELRPLTAREIGPRKKGRKRT